MLRQLLAACAVFACLFPGSAFAAWPDLSDVPAVEATGTADVAVIVAVEDYLLLPDIPGAIQNANEWEVFLRSGMKVPTVHVLANQDATREEMLKFAKTAAADVSKGGTIWWIFIGHGAPSVKGDDGLLVGMDAQQSVESLQSRGLPQKELLAALNTPKARTVMIVDACFSGRSQDGGALAAGVQPVVAVDPTSVLSKRSVVLSAAKATEVAGQLDGVQRPAFSYLMLGALRGWADDGDGAVTAEEALFYARRQLRGVKGRQQTPQASGTLSMVLAKGVTESGPKMVEQHPREEGNCGSGKQMVNGKCVEAGGTQQPVAQGDEAERTLQYLQRRITFQGKRPRQGTRALSDIAFYHEIGRPDLADKYMGHNPYIWVPGIAATVGGVALMVWGFSGDQSAGESGRIIGGFMGGFFTFAGGISMITFGFIFPYQPMSFAQRKSAAEMYNSQLRDELQLGPEVDWQNEPVHQRSFGIFGSNEIGPRLPVFGVTVRF